MSAVQITAVDLDQWENEGGAIYADAEPEAPRHTRMTYRERRIARAEKLRGWAEKREQRAEQAYDRATELGQQIPFGQPILVGHYSEKGHRAHLARIDSAMRQSCESSAMAARMEEKADSIEYQAKHAIYNDDPDAIDRLAAKVAKLEAQRDQMKAANVTYRNEHQSELRAMTAYQRSTAVPFPSWALTNIGATIRTARKRLEQLQREAVSGPMFRTTSARFDSCCAGCGQPIEKGSTIRYARGAGAHHVGCEVKA